MSQTRRYWHDEVGFNYRLTNLQAALGLAQLRKVDQILERKTQISSWYRQELDSIPGLTLPPQVSGYTSVGWLFSILVDPMFGMTRDELAAFLADRGIETRPFFYPLHMLPAFVGLSAVTLPVAVELSQKGLSLPSGASLDRATIEHVCDTIREASQRG